MLRRGNRDILTADQRRYDRILRNYDRIGQKREKEEGEGIIILLIISLCSLLILGAIISILQTIYGMHS
ncbi:MAG: hypothetical protein KGI54_06965 [Pseudomonadota bacterium]|nr:hypothetical protein [Pseudomonadota bacterium]